MTQVAATNESVLLTDADFDFWVAECNSQLEECCAAYEIQFTPVEAYRTADGLPQADVRVATFVDSLPEAPDAAAYHTVDEAGRVLSRMIASYGPSAFSHENCEEAVDPGCNKTVTRPDGAVLDFEICDPVQADVRNRSVTVLGETREIEVSNFTLPSYWDPSGQAPFDAFGLVTRPFEVRKGGYQVVNGVPVFGEGDEVAARAVAARAMDPGSRMNRRRG